MCGPTRASVLSTHSATSSNVRGILLSLGLQHQREAYFHGVRHLFGAFPVALPRSEIQPFELGGSLDLRARRALSELKIDGDVLGHAAQRQRADRRITRGGLGEAARDIVSG